MAEWFKDKWPFNKPRKVEKGEAEFVKICDLPLYADKSDDADLASYRYVMEEPLPLQDLISSYRIAVQEGYSSLTERIEPLQKSIDATRDVATKGYNYIQEEGTVLPKAIAITVGGMAGFLWGMKKGGAVKRVAFSGLGMGVLAAFCYPHETVDVARTVGSYGREHIPRLWRDFVEPPPPPAKLKEESKDKAPKTSQSEELKDKDMYTTRS